MLMVSGDDHTTPAATSSLASTRWLVKLSYPLKSWSVFAVGQSLAKLPAMKFVATLDRDEDGIWISECPAIPGCVSQGSTREEALANVREAIALCLEVRAERGLPLTIETRQIEVTVWMAILPSLSGREVVKVFEADGWRIAWQRGSHIILVKDGHIATLSVPDHREVAKGTFTEFHPSQRPNSWWIHLFDWQVRYVTTEREKFAIFRHAKF
jgi:predicted RNase H-like HicB family nuclease/predicted RNA binding protein YcfA (HicA-like mRNA interferase family)